MRARARCSHPRPRLSAYRIAALLLRQGRRGATITKTTAFVMPEAFNPAFRPAECPLPPLRYRLSDMRVYQTVVSYELR